ncbi:ankyrin repeat-containing domain protein [Rhypophila decipiens]|uniref:Ankyrin repeat-containing domain protein n=1 Tax=Rhypophila decipiens TaxID=261697 RepID=A0AAN7B5N3_9PEZI|nr:ankyrin repeat-containing domain protein [Rhypophila decipiens]
MAEYIAAATVFWSAGKALESAISNFFKGEEFIKNSKREGEHARTELGILRSKIQLYHSSLSTDERTALSNAINDFHDRCDEYDGIISNLLKELGKFKFDEQESKARSVARKATWKVARSKHRFEEIKDELCTSRTRINDIFRHLITDHDHGRRPSLPETGSEYQLQLFRAISDGAREWVQHLLDNGANATASFIDNHGHETTPIHKAAELGRLGIVKLLREHDAELDASDSEQATPLILAIKNERLEMAKYLINAHMDEQRADPSFDVIRSINLADSSGNHALAYLIKLRLERLGETRNWNEILKSLLELKADPVTKIDFSYSPLHYCAANNLVKELGLLLNAPCSLEGGRLDTAIRLKYQDDILEATPLWLAARNGDLASVKILSERGADHALICKASSTLPTPLWAAYAAGSLDTFTYLLEKPGTDPNFKNTKGLSILHALVLKYVNPAQFAQWVEPLLAHPDTDPNIRDSTEDATDEQSTGLTPLHYAAREAKLPIVQLLLHTPRCRDKTTSINIDVTQDADSNPLKSQNKHTLINIDINAPDKEAETPERQDIHTSINIDIKAPSSSSTQNRTTPSPNPIPIDINAPDCEGKTPLMTSISLYTPILGISSPHHPITTYLLQQGALITPLDINGYDAFFWACAVGDVLSAACLLAQPQPARDRHHHPGRQLNRQTAAKGMTPLHVAAKAGKADMVRWLLAMGADKRVECRKPFEGCSVVGTAAEVAGEGGGNEEVVQVIERFGFEGAGWRG